MTFLEKINRILVACMLGLVFLQGCLLVLLKSMHEQAEYRLVKNSTKHEMSCGGDQFADANYWSVLGSISSAPIACSDADCDYSTIVWNHPEQKSELHVVAVQTAPPFRWVSEGDGNSSSGVVTLKVKKSERPQILALVSGALMEWDIQIDSQAKIEKVIVASPVTVWLKGLPAEIPIEYVPKEKMCSYPWTWEEAFNPENEFRMLLKSLRTISGVQEVSFQGAKVGRQFTVPSPAQGRDVASIKSSTMMEDNKKIPSVMWAREQGKVISTLSPVLEKSSVSSLPNQARWVTVTPTGLTFAIVKGALHLWSLEKKEFQRVWVPLVFPEAQNVTALAYDSSRGRLWIYNNERSGELFSYELENAQWSLVNDGIGKNIIALTVQSHGELSALVRRSTYAAELVTYDGQGIFLSSKNLEHKVAVDTLRWQWNLVSKVDKSTQAEQLWLQLISTANPTGDWHILQ